MPLFSYKEGQTVGSCDGKILNTRYFIAPPNSAIFTTVDCLLSYDATSLEKVTAPASQKRDIEDTEISEEQSAYFPKSYSQAVTRTSNNVAVVNTLITERKEGLGNDNRQNLSKYFPENSSSSEKSHRTNVFGKFMIAILAVDKKLCSHRQYFTWGLHYTVWLYQLQSISNFIDHASYVENLLKKDQLQYESSLGTNIKPILDETISRKKSMDIGDQVVCLDGKIPTYGVIKRIFSKDGHRHAEVAFVSIPLWYVGRGTIKVCRLL